MVLFKKAFNQVYKEFSIIGTIKRKSPESKEVFNGPAFIKFVEHTEGDSLYTPIWEKYGGEYLEMANAYPTDYVDGCPFTRDVVQRALKSEIIENYLNEK
jgi:hypothetical protein